MSSTLTRVRDNLRRPMPDLVGYLVAKIRSAAWRPYLRHVGRGFHVGAGAQLQGCDRISIGEDFVAGPLLWIEAVKRFRDDTFDPTIEIGANVTCSQGVHIAATSRVTIHDGVMFGSRVHVTDHGHGTYRGDTQDRPDVPPRSRRLSDGRPVVIERNVWLGDGVVVLPGVTIGAGSIVGANSVVSRNLPPGVIAVGAPAVPIKTFDPASGRWIDIETSP